MKSRLIVEQLESRQLLALSVIGVIDSLSESSSLYKVLAIQLKDRTESLISKHST